MYKYRLAEERDIDALLAMSMKFYAHHKDSVQVPIDPDSVVLTMLSMIENQGLIVVAYESDSEESLPPVEEQGPIVAMLGFAYFRPSINIHVLAAQERMFWIEEEHRGTSLARTMLSVAHVGLKADAVDYSYLTKLSNSPEAVDHLYASMGYQPAETSFVRSL
jgi:hypothetical protein